MHNDSGSWARAKGTELDGSSHTAIFYLNNFDDALLLELLQVRADDADLNNRVAGANDAATQ
jgi:hypothetical protein